MITKQLLAGIEYEVLQGTDETEIEAISWDSRKVKPGSLFICVKGRNVDRHDFAALAAASGASVVVIEHEVGDLPAHVNIIRVDNSRRAMARIASNFYHEPSKFLNLIGITGTNGKTSVSWFAAQILENAGRRTGVIGTIENRIMNGKQVTVEKINPTTPDSIELHALFREMLDDGVNDIAMEVTSAALENSRVDECKFDIGVFTNLTQDHLDEHGTMENYKAAKLKLFDMCRYGVANADDPVCQDIQRKSGCSLLMTYGIDNFADFRAENIQYSYDGVRFILNFNGIRKAIHMPVPGKFSVYNALAAIAACYLSGLTLEQIAAGVERLHGVRGRFETVPNGRDCLVIVDYAHTPDGLDNILRSAGELTRGRLIAVFGCGGDRDRTKRPVMGEIAGNLAEYCIITSDNPRTEVPSQIINEIEAGIVKTKCRYEKIEDRKTAICKALQSAMPGDAIVIAGKGHENYQIFADRTIHFDDAEVVREYFVNDGTVSA